ncbi:MAG: ASCH domain-containing protein [Candidatus Dojkabacteria bacterium]
MSRKLGLIEKIVSGEKRIESRWYKNKIAPWDRVNVGDTIYFKYSGGSIIAQSTVKKVLQIEHLDESKFQDIVSKYGDLIQLNDRTYSEYYKRKRYVILIFLQDSKYLERPFDIDKTGYGYSCAWMCISDKEFTKRIIK